MGSLDVKTVLFGAIQLSISMQFSPIWPIVRTLSGATTLDQRGPESNTNERVHSQKFQHKWNLIIRLFSVISRILVGGGGSYPSAEVQSAYSIVPADRAMSTRSIVYRCTYCVSIAGILRQTSTNKWTNTSFNSNNLLINMWNNE